MTFQNHYAVEEPAREAIDRIAGDVLVEFGAPWCPHCVAAQAPLAQAIATRDADAHEKLVHYKIEDGPGRPLGRSFRVKLWPTLILLRNGVEVARAVRPIHVDDIMRALFSE